MYMTTDEVLFRLEFALSNSVDKKEITIEREVIVQLMRVIIDMGDDYKSLTARLEELEGINDRELSY